MYPDDPFPQKEQNFVSPWFLSTQPDLAVCSLYLEIHARLDPLCQHLRDALVES